MLNVEFPKIFKSPVRGVKTKNSHVAITNCRIIRTFDNCYQATRQSIKSEPDYNNKPEYIFYFLMVGRVATQATEASV
ncbi:MAG: hypothetical protein V2J65_31920, partial [Desulfobacteraceae bacterium]|nr:hypothetical protein [Desulfobacteraceae bacterium]